MSAASESVLLENPQAQNYIRLQYLLGVTVTDYLRELFYKEWKSYTTEETEWENLPENGEKFVNSVGSTLYKSAKAIQKKYLKNGIVTMWDLPLLVDAVKCFPMHKSEMQKKNVKNKSFDKLKIVRNQQAHLGSIFLDEESFNGFWQDATDALISLGISQDALDIARTIKLQTEQISNLADNINEADQKRANDLKDQGNLNFKNKNFKDAILFYTEAILIPNLPNDYLAVLYSNRSVSYMKSGDWENAKEDAKGAMHLCPTWWKGYHRLSTVYQERQKFAKALKFNEIAMALAPSQLELKDARDYCQHMIKKKKREEHMDPQTFCNTTEDAINMLKKLGCSANAKDMEAAQKNSFQMGNPFGISAEGQRYLHGINVSQNFETAAGLFAKSAAKGCADGMYNLALLTMEGKGVRRNISQAIRLLNEAAMMDPIIELIPGVKLPNVGVSEAQHALALAYHDGSVIDRDFKKAIYWYKKCLANGSNGSPANNLGLMHLKGEGVVQDLEIAFLYFKVAALKGAVRSMENLAMNYLRSGKLKLAQKWYTLGVEHESISLPLNKEAFSFDKFPLRDFDSKLFLEEIRQEVMNGPLREFVEIKETNPEVLFRNAMLKKDENKCGGNEKDNSLAVDPLTAEYRVQIILRHRQNFKDMKKKGPKTPFTTQTQQPKLQPRPILDLFGLKPIFLKDMDEKKDKIYEGFAIKLTMIEDALVGDGRNSVGLIGEDDNGDIQRIYVYNYSQNKETEETLGFGNRVTVVNPYFRVTTDGKPAIRIDDPSLLFIHSNLKNASLCRFCRKENALVPCRKCRRVCYCSSQCLKKDTQELSHELVCIKHL